jgi:4-hydroxy-tetrahydrodipicolinate synthase
MFAFFDRAGLLDRGAMRVQAQQVMSMGVDGFVTLGLATEVGKLTLPERLALIEWMADDAHDLPFAVTVTGNGVAEQREILRAAEGAGATLAILQPPLVGSFAANEYLEFFAAVGKDARLPLAIQNAPQYLGRTLAAADLSRVRARMPTLGHVKAEIAATDLGAFIADVGDDFVVLNGRGGLEMTDCLRAGAQGFIVAPDVAPGVIACWHAWKRGDVERAEAHYASFLPAALFGMQSLEHLACYGKRIFAARAGLTVHDRSPAMRPSPLGLQLASRWARTAATAPGPEEAERSARTGNCAKNDLHPEGGE